MILVMYSNFAPSAAHLTRLAAASGGMEVGVAKTEAEAMDLASSAEIILGHRYLWQTLERAPKVRWVQSTAAGMEHIVTPILRLRRPLLTRSTVPSKVVALHALAMALALVRRLPLWMQAGDGPRHDRSQTFPPSPRKAVVLGFGSVGCLIAGYLRSLGIEVVGVARSRSSDKEAACDRLVGHDDWRSELGDTDLLFVAVPLDDSTRGLIDAEVFAALPDHAVIASVTRGACINWPAAAEALQTQRLGGLAVDATDALPEAGDPIWQSPRFLQTPKVAALYPGFQTDLEAYVEIQVARYFSGEPLLNVVAY